jgi:hypothetical protein
MQKVRDLIGVDADNIDIAFVLTLVWDFKWMIPSTRRCMGNYRRHRNSGRLQTCDDRASGFADPKFGSQITCNSNRSIGVPTGGTIRSGGVIQDPPCFVCHKRGLNSLVDSVIENPLAKRYGMGTQWLWKDTL